MTLWTASEDRQLTRLWAREDLTKADIGRALGRSYGAVGYRALCHLGLPPRKQGLKSVNHPVREWASMLKAGKSLAAIGRSAGITAQRVHQVLVSRGMR